MTVVPSVVSTLYDWAQELVTASNDALATTVGGVIDRAFVSPSLPALDCCPQLTVHVQAVAWDNNAPLTPFPAPGHRAQIRGMALVTLVATVVRCQPTPDSANALLVPIADLESAAREVDEDVWAIWNHVRELVDAGDIWAGRCGPVYLDAPVPLSASGGCAGWVLTFRVGVGGYNAVP